MTSFTWSCAAWLVSLTAVVVSGAVAAAEGNWRRSTRLHLGFATHGGMWGDAVLLPIVNALVVPWIVPGTWLIGPLLGGLVGTVLIHAWWHGGHDAGVRDHLWPTRPTGRWSADLSWSGWCHVVYVAVESALLLAFAVSATPAPVTWIVSGLLTAHVLVGVLQPSWMATGRFVREDLALAAAALTAVWVVAAFKLAG